MEHRTLGADGPLVMSVGLGAMSFGGMYGATTEEASRATMAKALEIGVNHWDVANIYGGEGVCENILGRFFKDHPDARSRITLATKGAIIPGPPRQIRNDPEYMRGELEKSLERLSTDHVDLYYIHRRDHDTPIETIIEVMGRWVEEGLIGGIGLSECAPSTLERAASVFPIRAVQSEYSLWTRLPDLGMIDLCRRLGTAFVAFSSVGRGMFGESPLTPEQFHKGDFRRANPRFSAENFPRNEEKVAAFRALATEIGLPAPVLANAWVLARAPHIHVIPGTRSPVHLEQNAEAAAVTLTTEQMAAIETVLPAGFAHGSRYASGQTMGVEDYC
ncbi:aldo/keto reductase [Notoacmeibacter sp. MSK16QG-6]|uniref:aldo/keto reductase n=1 Tax=Notoacmeibacter sp. MSK16QG-6 TaxID=2957982 RepID=UPI0020A16344|nr:aldo/keto reductase [Notoacmeibacter sp. MSK16QG-6]MCP1199274.1 aldo/keto reductase [Notoacmeibacter sp. MSK16QG-6]